MAYGYPEGGTSLSITKGIVSRIEFAHYSLAVGGLQIQIDAAINSGNSGGPAVVGGKMIGLVFSRLRDADNIGYIIPNEEIELFLDDLADGTYSGKPAMFDELQTLENPALRSFLKLGKDVEGLVVHRPGCSEIGYPLKKWDLITRIGDAPIDNLGKIKLPDTNLRVGFRYLLQKIARNGVVRLTVVRAGKELPIELPVSSTRPKVLAGLEGAYPSYFIYGPLVFSSATADLVGGLAKSEYGAGLMDMLSIRGSPLVRRMGDKPAFDGECLVIVSSPFFPSKLAKGYDNPIARVVKTVSGVPIKNLGHLVEVLRDSRDEFITIEFDIRGAETLVFRRTEMLAATDEILKDNGVRSQGSADTLSLWSAKPREVALH